MYLWGDSWNGFLVSIPHDWSHQTLQTLSTLKPYYFNSSRRHTDPNKRNQVNCKCYFLTVTAIGCPTSTSLEPSGANIFAKYLKEEDVLCLQTIIYDWLTANELFIQLDLKSSKMFVARIKTCMIKVAMIRFAIHREVKNM